MVFLSFLKQHWFKVITIVVVGCVTAMMEGLSLTLVFPILQGMTKPGTQAIPFPLNLLSSFFIGIPLYQRLRIVAVLLIATTALRASGVYFNALLAARLQLAAMKYYRMLCARQLMRVRMGFFYNQ